MASIYNSYLCVSGNNYGAQENVQNYSSVLLNLNTNYSLKVPELPAITFTYTYTNSGQTPNLGTAVALWKMVVNAFVTGGGAEHSKSFTVQGSQNGGTWISIPITIVTNSSVSYTLLINDPSHTAYLYYKVTVMDNQNNSDGSLAVVQFYILDPTYKGTCTVNLNWYGNNSTAAIVTDTFSLVNADSIVKHYDVKAPILEVDAVLAINPSMNCVARLTTSYKSKPTQVLISDPTAPSNVARLSGNAIYTSLTDTMGGFITNTSNTSTTLNRALDIHLADAAGRALCTVSGATLKATTANLTDKSNIPISSTGAKSNAGSLLGHKALCINTTDKNGHIQAGTYTVSGASFGGAALFYSLTDNCGISITTCYTNISGWGSDMDIISDTCNTAVNITLVNNNGFSISNTHGQVIYSSNNVTATITSFSTSLDCSMVSLGAPSLSLLRQLGITNDTPNTVWVKVYNVGTIDDANHTYNSSYYTDFIKFNIAVPAQSYRDLTMSYGVSMENGIILRATSNYTYGSPFLTGPSDGAYVYVTGTYEEPP